MLWEIHDLIKAFDVLSSQIISLPLHNKKPQRHVVSLAQAKKERFYNSPISIGFQNSCAGRWKSECDKVWNTL